MCGSKPNERENLLAYSNIKVNSTILVFNCMMLNVLLLNDLLL